MFSTIYKMHFFSFNVLKNAFEMKLQARLLLMCENVAFL
jgi:hypothetical protein